MKRSGEGRPHPKPNIYTFSALVGRKPRRVVIFTHRHADPDAYCSAFALREALGTTQKPPKVDVIIPGGISQLTERLSHEFALKTEAEPPGDPDAIFVMDSGSPSLLDVFNGWVRDQKCAKILIDHHPIDEDSRKIFTHLEVDQSVSSTCEILLRILEKAGIIIGTKVAEALLAGILFDSQHLTSASQSTLAAVVALCEKGASLEKIRSLMALERERSEIIARFLAGKRCELARIGEYYVAWTKIGSFQSSAARALVELGADMAFAYGENDGMVRCGLRSSRGFTSRSGIRLGEDVAMPLAAKLNGSGGGHPRAATFEARAPQEDLPLLVLELLVSLTGSGLTKENLR